MKFFDRFKKEPKIEFLCFQEDFGNIPAPYPARKLIPEWYKALPMRLHPGLESGTVKRCPPFLDAMTAGWIIPLVADVQIKTNGDASYVEYDTQFHRSMIENHNHLQITSSKCPNPVDPKPPIKFMNWWAIKCPPGYSLLFVPPLNRPDPRFTIMSGLVDADGYFEFINFPFVFNEPNFHGIIEAGTPLAQVIPIKRDTMFKESIVRAFTDRDIKDLNDTRCKRRSHISHYRDNVWTKK
jgi:hypothetical protein